MARRAKKQARRNGGGGVPGWVWLLVGLLGGVVVAGYLIMRSGWSGDSGLLPRPDPQAQAPVAWATCSVARARRRTCSTIRRSAPRNRKHAVI